MGSPGTGFDVTVAGYIHGGFFLQDIDANPLEDPADREDYGSTDVKMGGSEIQFTATTVLDTGIEVSGRVELAGFTDDDQIDETYIGVEGGFGRMVLGAENGASNLMHYSAPWYGTLNGIDSPNYRYAVYTAARTGTQTAMSGDAFKITYFTPRFSGFQFGISYTPDNLNRDGGNTDLDRNAGEGVENIVEVGGNFTRPFGNVVVGASAGWESGSSNVKAGTAGVKDDPSNWHIGGNVSRGGFTVGGAYYRATGFLGAAGTNSVIRLSNTATTHDLVNDMDTHSDLDDEVNTTTTTTVYDVDVSDQHEQTAWVIGAQYATGPWSVGIGYLQATTEGPRAGSIVNNAGVADNAIEAETSVVGITGSYEMGPGVIVAADVGFYEDDNGAAGDDNRSQEAVGAGLILGISF